MARVGGQLWKTLSRGDLVANRTGTGAWVRKRLRLQRFWLLNREQWQGNFAACWFMRKEVLFGCLVFDDGFVAFSVHVAESVKLLFMGGWTAPYISWSSVRILRI